VDLEVFDIKAIAEGDFYVKLQRRNEAGGLQWILIEVLWDGAAQDEFWEAFLVELVQICSKETHPFLSVVIST
jgi:hypothetical protein